MLKCLIAFILGWLISRQMGNGFSVGVILDKDKPLPPWWKGGASANNVENVPPTECYEGSDKIRRDSCGTKLTKDGKYQLGGMAAGCEASEDVRCERDCLIDNSLFGHHNCHYKNCDSPHCYIF